MEKLNQINFLSNPLINQKSLYYVIPVNICTNCFEIKLVKEIKIYQYPFAINPEIDIFDSEIIQNIFKEVHSQILNIYGIYFIDGNSIYSLLKVKEGHLFLVDLRLRQNTNKYVIIVDKYENMRIINEKDINENSSQKQFIELVIKDILSSNPNLERFKDTYIRLDKKEKIVMNQSLSFDYYSGFKFDLVNNELGNFLYLTLAHKLIRNENILEWMERF